MEGEITQKKQLFTFKLVSNLSSKKSMRLGVYTLEEAKEWIKCLSVTESGIPSESVQENIVPEVSRPNTYIKDTPRDLDEVIKLFNSTDKWTVKGNLVWEYNSMIKVELLVEDLSENIVEYIEKYREKWDWSFDSYREISSVGIKKIIAVSLNKKPCCIVSNRVIDTFKSYIIQTSVPHLYYPSYMKYFQYFCVSEHPAKHSYSLVSMITDRKELVKPFKSMPNFIALQEFRTLMDEVPYLAIAKSSTNINCYSFDEFFIYGPGGSYERDELKGSLVLKDKAILSKQKKVLTYMLRTIGKNLLSGKSVMSISLPVSIFQPISMLQRTCGMFGYAPIFMERALEFTDVEKFKYMLALSITILHMSTEQRKPFNPVVGETFEGTLGSMKAFSEQTSHHPPITHFYMTGSDFSISGYNEYMASTSFNSVKARQRGINKLVVGSDVYYLSLPQVVISGITYGARVFSYTGVLTLMDPQNKLFCELIFNPYKKGYFGKGKSPSDYFKGIIFRVSEEHPMMSAEGRTKIQDDGKKPLASGINENINEVGVADGFWPVYLQVDGVKYWEFDSYRPYKILPIENCLPSDSTWRKDILALENGQEDAAQKFKDQIENLQRYDKKLRERH